jgi:hypothetical protein
MIQMKKFLMIISFLMLLSLILVPATMALPISSGDWVEIESYNPLDMAGILTFNVSHSNNGTIFTTYETFCIQENVFIYPSTWYQVEISSIVGPNSPSVAGYGTLNGAVDYLFYKYKTGAYDAWLNGSNTNQADFQNLLWSLQGEIGPYTPGSGTPWAVDLANYTNLGQSWGTEVINIYTSTYDASGKEISRTDIQNQLYNQVPEPMTLLLLGSGLIGITGLRRKFKK